MPAARWQKRRSPLVLPSATIQHPSSDKNALWQLWHPGRRLKPRCGPRLSRAVGESAPCTQTADLPEAPAIAFFDLVLSPASSAKEPCPPKPRVIGAQTSVLALDPTMADDPAPVPRGCSPVSILSHTQVLRGSWKWAPATFRLVPEQVCWPRVPKENACSQCP